ncbi:DUF6471 domain-containing protein [Phenylobacterium sp. LH3H17]|uniref:DUF6471 domain-containing protein n=1 Tax=Phenylobacterium sp. LH3H17 TaxID=2903901 RepID=UPI0020CA0E51|nr:DUF6471 domain-containing protein [Phenylobacterium sp. LH3H17]UTP39816.1 DUF6471 domain-containing protein [Phenylobacterium sp. LH3H17]
MAYSAANASSSDIRKTFASESDRMMMFIALGDMGLGKEWEERAKGLLKGKLKRRQVGYAQLAVRLDAMGITESSANIANKISRGAFTAVCLLQCMEAIGPRLRMGED